MTDYTVTGGTALTKGKIAEFFNEELKKDSATKGATLTKEKIAEFLNEEIGLSKEDSSAIVGDILNEIIEGLIKDGEVKISSFGTFIVRKKKERPGNILGTSKKVMISERNSIYFKPSQKLKDLINVKKTEELIDTD